MSTVPGRPTGIRYALLGVATANAFLLYLDRSCMGAVVQSESFRTGLGLSKDEVGNVLASFFFAYALGQLPAGWLADRFGPRRMLLIYILLWSACTAMTGAVGGLISLAIVRCACGLAEAGAYPASSRVVARWFPIDQRARASSVVAFGGRVGNAIALWLTALGITMLGSWRPILWIYGAAGLGLAALTWIIFRDEPRQHPWVNEAERERIGTTEMGDGQKSIAFPWRELLGHRGLWILSVGAIGMNLGWAFLITWLPNYLREVRGLDEVTASRYVTVALSLGMSGMLFGGWWCDALTRWFGQRWGRRLPGIIGGVVAMAAYLVCPMLGGALGVAVACGVVAFASDSITPSIWTVAQDVGGRHVAATMAWTNMWGNLGASAVSRLIPLAIGSTWHFADWREVFWMCGAGFALLAVAVLFVDTTRPLLGGG